MQEAEEIAQEQGHETYSIWDRVNILRKAHKLTLLRAAGVAANSIEEATLMSDTPTAAASA